MTGESLAALAGSYLDLRWTADPVAATAQGVSEYDHRLGLQTDEDVRQHVAALRALGSALEEVQVETLDDEVDRTALLGEIRSTIHRMEHERPHVRDPVSWISHVLEGLYLLLVVSDRTPEARARAAAGRVREVPAYLEQARAMLTECPRVLVQAAVDMVPGGTALLHEVARRLAPADDPSFASSCDDAADALDGFARFLEEDLLEEAPDAAGIGEEAFNFRLHFQHALRWTAPEVWRFGTALVASVTEAVATQADRIAPGADWRDVVDRLRADGVPGDEVVAAQTAAMVRARRFVEDRALVHVPDGELRVEATPRYLRPIIPVAAYQPPGAFAPDRTGRFYVTTAAAQGPAAASAHCAHGLAVTALHEGYPGHHLHFLAAQAQERVVRRVVWTPVTIEGWALYCEEMMEAEGFFATAEERLFQKLALLWRACRVVLDVGLHTRGMSVADAERMLRDQAHLDEGQARAEVRRYCSMPAYQLAYAVGLREVTALRDAYLADRNGAGSVRQFHDAFLRFGGIPVSLIRWGMGVNGA